MKKKATFVTLSVLALVVVFVGLEKLHVIDLFHHNTNIASSGRTPEQKTQEDAANADAKKQLIENNKANDANSSNQAQSDATVELGARTGPNNTVTVFTKLYGVSGGTCSLSVINGANHKTYDVAVIYQTEYSTCAGFSIPISDLSHGTWNIALAVKSNSQTYNKTIEFTVQ